jgi:hypothetical protein
MSLGLRGDCIGVDDLVLQSCEIEEAVASTTPGSSKVISKPLARHLSRFTEAETSRNCDDVTKLHTKASQTGLSAGVAQRHFEI